MEFETRMELLWEDKLNQERLNWELCAPSWTDVSEAAFTNDFRPKPYK